MGVDAKEAIRRIRKGLRSLGFTGRVRMSRGTGFGSVWLWARDSMDFEPKNRRVLEFVGLPYGGNAAIILGDERDFWLGRIEAKAAARG